MAPKNKHYVPLHKQFLVDIRPWIYGITIIVLCAAIITLVGLLVITYRSPGLGVAILLVGLFAVALGGAFWAASVTDTDDQVPA